MTGDAPNRDATRQLQGLGLPVLVARVGGYYGACPRAPSLFRAVHRVIQTASGCHVVSQKDMQAHRWLCQLVPALTTLSQSSTG